MKTNDANKNVKNEEVAANTTTLEDSSLGNVKIHEDVIASLVRFATLEVPGVSRLAGSSLIDGIAEIVGNRRMQARAISIDLRGDNQVLIEVKVNILTGFRLPEVAEKIQKAVVSKVENTTGITVKKVDVVIQEIDKEKGSPEADSDDKSDKSAE